MIIWWRNKKRAKTVRGSRRVKRRCPKCEETTHFRECTVTHDVSVYSVKLWDDEYRAFACSNCDEVMDLDDTLEPELSEREQRKLEKERQRALEAARRERERKEAEKTQLVDHELAALKRKLGKE